LDWDLFGKNRKYLPILCLFYGLSLLSWAPQPPIAQFSVFASGDRKFAISGKGDAVDAAGPSDAIGMGLDMPFKFLNRVCF
jgi:hypothetical protein